MKNYFNFNIGDYVMYDGRACRLYETTFKCAFTDLKSIFHIVPIPFTFKVLEGLVGFWYTTKDVKAGRRRFYEFEIFRDRNTSILYAYASDVRVYFMYLHEFQAYLKKYFDYELEDEKCCYGFTDHINDLYLMTDYIIINGKPSQRVLTSKKMSKRKAYS